MKLRRETRTLRSKSVASLRRGLVAFNGFDDDGRVTSVLLHLQHSCEMLLKAVLVQRRINVFDKRLSRALGFDRCLGLAEAHGCISATEAGVMRTVDALRNCEQHWILTVQEEILYLHVRALVTAVDDVLERVLREKLVEHLPIRVLPVSTSPITDISLLVDAEFTQVRNLLKPGRRAREDARARIRALLAMEAHVVDTVSVTERDIDRVEEAVRSGEEIGKVFPRLLAVQSLSDPGHGFELKVRFTKKDGAPIRYVSGDDAAEVAAIREVDLQKKFYLSAGALAEKLELTKPKAKAVRDSILLDSDPSCIHVFEFGRQKIPRYSDSALVKMRDCLANKSADLIWAEVRASQSLNPQRCRPRS